MKKSTGRIESNSHFADPDKIKTQRPEDRLIAARGSPMMTYFSRSEDFIPRALFIGEFCTKAVTSGSDATRKFLAVEEGVDKGEQPKSDHNHSTS